MTVDLHAAGGTRLPALLAANAETDASGAPTTIRFALQDASDRRAYERELLAERQRAEQERARATALARTLKRSLLPPALSPPAGLEASAHLHAASDDEVGGDFYDLFALGHDRSAFFLGDVCGKGSAPRPSPHSPATRCARPRSSTTIRWRCCTTSTPC